jgi:hypothetical protein
MDTCLSKFEELKQRAEKLQYNDLNEQDDIMRKTELYVLNCFVYSASSQNDLKSIKFTPLYSFGSQTNEIRESAWENGRYQLVNFLDTRLEELKLKSKRSQVSSTEKVINKVYVEDASKIKVHQDELTTIKNNQRLWKRIDYSVFVSASLIILGGSFLLGFYFGNNRFDKEKIQLYNENIQLMEQIDSFRQTKVTNEI